ncbi:MAG TPA: hypothetical protein VMV10_29115 [Pirellulales bacterium]|nr:hypothetical protein [Pirellulales bacterium]
MDASAETPIPKPRFQFALRKLFAMTFIVAVVCAAATYGWRLANAIRGVNLLGFGSDHGAENLTYEEFSSAFGSDFDPQGASQISLRVLQSRDGYDEWAKMTIAADHYAALVKRFAKNMEDPDFVSYKGKMASDVLRIQTDDSRFPADWPEPDGDTPRWWLPPSAGSDLVCARWEVQVDDSSYSSRAKGWYFLYNRADQTLWIWEWNRQHHRLEGR